MQPNTPFPKIYQSTDHFIQLIRIVSDCLLLGRGTMERESSKFSKPPRSSWDVFSFFVEKYVCFIRLVSRVRVFWGFFVAFFCFCVFSHLFLSFLLIGKQKVYVYTLCSRLPKWQTKTFHPSPWLQSYDTNHQAKALDFGGLVSCSRLCPSFLTSLMGGDHDLPLKRKKKQLESSTCLWAQLE